MKKWLSRLGPYIYTTFLFVVVPVALWAAQTYVISTGSTEHSTEHLTNLLNRDAALRSNFSGASAPSSPVGGQFWIDSDDDKLSIRDTGDTAWLEVVEKDQTQTLTGKTLTAPVFSGTTTGTYTLGGTPTISGTVQGDITLTGGIDAGNNGDALKTKIIDIGDWNMDTTIDLQVSHGLTQANIRVVAVLIRDDADAIYTMFPAEETFGSTNEQINVTSSDIDMDRATSGGFDNTGYNSTSFNRGWITIWYK